MGISKNIYVGPYLECSYAGIKKPRYSDAIDESFFCINPEAPNGEPILLTPNESRDDDPRPGYDDENEFSLDICAGGIEVEKSWLAHAFADEIKRLESIYASVAIKWGVHQYFM